VGLRAGLDVVIRKKSAPAGNQTSEIYPTLSETCHFPEQIFQFGLTVCNSYFEISVSKVVGNIYNRNHQTYIVLFPSLPNASEVLPLFPVP
jgi:hypothetical protein